MPYKHYETAVIESAILESEGKGILVMSGCPADDSTVRRWLNQFKERGVSAAGRLCSVLYEVYRLYANAIEMRTKGALEQLTRLLQMFPFPKIGTVIGGVNIILTGYNCGFL